MKLMFDNLSIKVSKLTTELYSTSFSLGIYMIDKRLRDHIYAIYGFVRCADEIVDSFENYDKKYLLKRFREDTFDAINHKISLNPVLNSFQHTVNQFLIDQSLITTFLDSMEMDLEKIDYNDEKYNQYILGSAEVVGLMCLHVFTEGNMKVFQELKPYAMKLGAAFQKVNFLRDLKDDYHILGRTYFPNIDISQFNTYVKKQIENDIAEDFKIALEGIRKLPTSSKHGVYLAYVYYVSLFKKIKRLPPHHILKQRVRINNGHKIGLLLNIFLTHKIKLA